MKAKQHFYALGQRAKAQGVNKQRAVRYFHMEAAPKWAKHAFLAGWEAADTEHQITYRFDELDVRAQQRVVEHFTPDHEWWEGVYDMVDEDSKEWFIDIGVRRRPLTNGRTIRELELYFDMPYNARVTFDGDIDLRAATKDWDNPLHQAIGVTLITEGAIPHTVGIKGSRLCDIETSYHDYEVEHGPLTGASIDDLIGALDDGGYFTALEHFLQDKIDAFKDHVETALEEEYEYLTSEEYVAELCEANDYAFDEDGKLI